MRRGTFLDEKAEREVQQPVLMSMRRGFVLHLLLHFPGDAPPAGKRGGGISCPEHFLSGAIRHVKGLAAVWSARDAAAGGRSEPVLMNLGFTFRGLKRLSIPQHVMTCLALKAPAFAAGAPQRAASHVGDSDESDAAAWKPAYAMERLHAVMSLHTDDLAALWETVLALRKLAARMNPPVRITLSPMGRAMRRADGNYVHFDLRDGLTSPDVRRANEPEPDDDRDPEDITLHEVGEFVLGYPTDTKSNPWIRDLAGQVLPQRVREFFLHGSFGVLRQMAQDTVGFADYVKKMADTHQDRIDPKHQRGDLYRRAYVVSRLLGRWPDGARSTAINADWPTVPPALPPAQPAALHPARPAGRDFNYEHDQKGYGCPFGAHVRRMNPRGTPIAQTAHRPLMRRGMPYGTSCTGRRDGIERGLLGWFFCTSIEEQFEHLLGQWADRVPLGSPDSGDAKDPLIGDNRPEARFVVPREDGDLSFRELQSFVTTRGTAYLFYPALSTVDKIIGDNPWAEFEDIPR
jgi:hypothetical protein